jgi:hypothetical protein
LLPVLFLASLVSPPLVHDKEEMTRTIKKLPAAVAVASLTLVAAPTLGHSRGWHGHHGGGHRGYYRDHGGYYRGYHGGGHGYRGCYGGELYYGYAYGGAYGWAPRGYGCW